MLFYSLCCDKNLGLYLKRHSPNGRIIYNTIVVSKVNLCIQPVEYAFNLPALKRIASILPHTHPVKRRRKHV